MPIHPLPQFEADLAEQDRELYERLKPPSSIVVRFGLMKMVGEFPYSGDAKPGCGSKLVVKTHRGTELGEMLTSTCPNAGCSKSVTRQEMLQYIENSGGREYPFFSMQGRVLRIATPEDLNEQAKIDSARPQLTRSSRAMAERMGLAMKIVDSEPIIGGEKLTFYFTGEDRVDFRELVTELASIHHTRIEMRQVGARDEARLVADYERCGQHCCCKQFLKVLKPISMKSAKIQKATLDPLKISGRCGRLMCCLRYEDETYDELRARLPKKKSRVKTPDGWGLVLDTQILTQLALVLLDHNNEQVAIAVEELEPAGPNNPAPPLPPPPSFDEGGSRGRPSRPPHSSHGPGGPPSARTGGPGPRPAAPPSPPNAPPPRPVGDRPAAPPPAPVPAEIDDDRAPRGDDDFNLDDIETDTGEGPIQPRRERSDSGGDRGPGGGGSGGPREGRDGGRRRRRGRGGGGEGRGPDGRGPDNRGGGPGQPPRPREEPRRSEPGPAGEAGEPRDGAGDEGGGDGPDGPRPEGGGGRRRRRRRGRGGGGGGGGGPRPEGGPGGAGGGGAPPPPAGP
jgi:cell fate regulator YaaT (PSP1 superfamily)